MFTKQLLIVVLLCAYAVHGGQGVSCNDPDGPVCPFGSTCRATDGDDGADPVYRCLCDCDYDAECHIGSCVDGACQTEPCDPPQPCPNGEACPSGTTCADTEENGEEVRLCLDQCVDTSDCKRGRICENGLCHSEQQ